jgi:23S rRNA G2445 N2-methylase RlmL
MLETCYNEIKQHTNPRENLSRIRSIIKDPVQKERFLSLAGDGALLVELLEEQDPKVRKNAALLLGDLQMQQALDALFHAYNIETTLFVKSSYLTAIGRLDVSERLPDLKKCLAQLEAQEPSEEERKHIQAEIRELREIITGVEGIQKHTFTGFCTEREVLLTNAKELRNVTLQELEELGIKKHQVELHPLGVLVHTSDVAALSRLRTYREMLLLLHTGRIPQDAAIAAAKIQESELWELLQECHDEPAPFYFRLEVKGHMELNQRAVFAKRFSAELERLSGKKLINSPKDYEIELRLIETREGNFIPFLKLYTIAAKRFAYRRGATATSMHPALAASLVREALPYLKEDAQILDPFCGVGTLLIERDILVPAREKYGVDMFGEAIGKGRENAAAAGQQIHFINRDYFDFQHDYLFDEIITDMPLRGKRSREEMDAFYAEFFRKSKEHLVPGAVIILYSNEEGFIKKQLRVQKEYRLLQESCIRKKEEFSLYVIGYKC